ncbi:MULTISPECIES: hypothetical protein [Bacilli]|uniref:hypothetical protein n=1 Tax=Bacilli TaxID=91061 RepID=UPI002557B284|nr:hypothetical protein [Streptococcus agalactiae]MDK8746887.1 hypothetical protein [Streptococcus agalactiae]
MFQNELDELIGELKKYDPELKESIIKPILRERDQKFYSYNIEPWVNYLKDTFSEEPVLIEEVNFLYNRYRLLEEDFKEFRVNEIYKDVIAGKIGRDKEIYGRQMIPYPGVSIIVNWQINKALELIKEKNLKVENFQLTKMNIFYAELNWAHLAKAKKNKSPGILLDYEPYAGTEYQYVLIDGNHRLFSILQRKNKHHDFLRLNRGIANQIKTEGPVYILESEESLASMQHPIFHYFYLLQVLLTQVKTYDEQSLKWANVVEDSNSRYNQLKTFVVQA